MKHIVFILGSYYPHYSAVGKCMGNIATVAAQSYKVTVISTQTQLNQPSVEEYQSQNIVRVSTPMNRWRMKLDAVIKNNSGIKYYFARLMKWVLRVVGVLQTFMSFTTIDSQLVGAYEEALNQLEDSVDVIIPTCIPFESVVSAMKYKERHPNVTLLPCLYDLFAANRNLNRTSWNQKLKWKNNLNLERKMFEYSEHVFHVANWIPHIEMCHKGYENKHTETEHPLLVCPAFPLKKSSSSKVHVVYTGIFDEKNRNPKDMLQILANVTHTNIVFDFYSFGSGQFIVEQFAREYPMVRVHGRVESQVAELARLNSAILLSLGNEDITQVPSKIIEYMATGKPIIHFAKCKEDPVVSLLNKYPYKKIIYMNESLSNSGLEDFIIKHKNTFVPFQDVYQTFIQATPEYLFAIMERYLSKFEE